MSDELNKDNKIVIKVSCELEEDTLETITNQIYDRIIKKFETDLRSTYRQV